MTPYSISGPSRLCAATGRELQAGERIMSALIDRGGNWVRADYAADAWPGKPEDCVAYWSSRMATQARPASASLNEGLLWDCFRHLAAPADLPQQQFRYVLTLMLMRKRRLRFEDTLRRDGRDYLLLKDAKSPERFEVLDPRLDEAHLESVQNEIFHLLGWN